MDDWWCHVGTIGRFVCGTHPPASASTLSLATAGEISFFPVMLVAVDLARINSLVFNI